MQIDEKDGSSYRGFIVPTALVLLLIAAMIWFPYNPLEEDKGPTRGVFDLAPPPVLELDEDVLSSLKTRTGHDIGYITNDYHNAVYIVDLTSHEYIGRLNFIAEAPRGGPDSIALTPDNQYFIVTRGKYSNDILVIDAHNYSLVKQIPGGKYNGYIEVNAMLNEAYILSGNYQDTNIYILDLQTLSIDEKIEIGDDLGHCALSGSTLCVTTQHGITIIDTLERRLTGNIKMNTTYWKRVVAHPTEPLIYVVNNPSEEELYPLVQVFNVDTGENVENIKRLTVDKTWDGAITCTALSPDGGKLFCVSQMNELVVVNTTDYSRIITRSVKQGDYYGKPSWVYFNENASKAYFIYWGGVAIDTPMSDSPSIIGVMDTGCYEFTDIIEFDEHAGLSEMAVTRHDSTPDMHAYIMVNRYAYSSTNHTMVTITDDVLERSPILSEAFRIEASSHAIGLVHPIEWVVCTDEEGRILEELILSLPSSGTGSIHLEYQGEKFQFTVRYGEEAPVIF